MPTAVESCNSHGPCEHLRHAQTHQDDFGGNIEENKGNYPGGVMNYWGNEELRNRGFDFEYISQRIR